MSADLLTLGEAAVHLQDVTSGLTDSFSLSDGRPGMLVSDALALAVADWLEAVRSCMGEPCRSMCCANERAAALRIARLILGAPA